jgi:L-ascorbate metabolism protein UlaG (beta-lactamase superfamily)
MAPPNFESSLTITHIGTATAIIDIDGIKLLTDPFFSPAGTEYDVGITVLKVSDDPALSLSDLPHIDGVLLSHEDHEDNLDPLGRRILDGRHVLTTKDGAKNLSPRPDVRGLAPWETIKIRLGGKDFTITGTPCKHVPGQECTGFIITTESFGNSPDGRPNAIWFSGDTVYFDELRQIRDRWHVTAAILNLGFAHAPGEILQLAQPGAKAADGPVQLTMGGEEGARIFRELEADVLVPMHFDSWNHFTEHGDELKKVMVAEGVNDKVCWLVPGEARKIF